MKDRYKKQVELLIRIMPSVYRIKEFAVHGGTAINLFYKNMPRYSVDIDLTYIPIEDRELSLQTINARLEDVKRNIEISHFARKLFRSLIWDAKLAQCLLANSMVEKSVRH